MILLNQYGVCRLLICLFLTYSCDAPDLICGCHMIMIGSVLFIYYQQTIDAVLEKENVLINLTREFTWAFRPVRRLYSTSEVPTIIDKVAYY